MAKNTQQSAQTIKQEREARRLEKVEAFKKQQARERRNRRIGAISGIAGGVLVLGLIVTVVVVNAQPKPDPATIEIAGLKTFPEVTGGVHVDGTPVDYDATYGMNPPAGGDHWSQWLNCGVYTEAVPNENAVHALEHGAVWITYDPSLSADEVAALQSVGPDTYMVVSPYEGLPSPIVLSAWGAQLQVDSIDDERVDQFITKYWKSATAPEPGASCVGGLDAPGRIA